MDWQALRLTLQLAAFTTAILLALTLPLAIWLVSSRAYRIAPAIEAILTLPLVLPPTVLGYYLLVLLGPHTGIGRTIAGILGHPLAFSFAGLVVGSTLYSLPFAAQPILAGLRSIDPRLIDAARLLGASPVRVARTIQLPLVLQSVVTAAVLSFLHTLGEFGVVLMLGGDIPGSTRTLSIVLYGQVENFDYAAANRTAGILLLLCAVSLTVLYAWRARRANLLPEGSPDGSTGGSPYA